MSDNQDIEPETPQIQTVETELDETAPAPSADESTAPTDSENPETKKDELLLCNNGEIVWNGLAIARLSQFANLFEPKFTLIGEELNREETATIVNERLNSWLNEQIRSELYPLIKLKSAIDFKEEAPQAVETVEVTPVSETDTETQGSDTGETLEPTPSPIVNAKKELSEVSKQFAQKILDAGGILDRADIESQIAAISQDNRRELRRIGVKFGRSAVYLPLLLKPKSATLNAILHHFKTNESGEVFVPKMGVTSFDAPEGIEDSAYHLIGFRNIAGRVIRMDILDRVQDSLFEALKEAKGAIVLPISVVSLLGVSNDNAQKVVEGLGWEKQTDDEGNVKWALKRVKPKFKKPMEGQAPKSFEKKFDGAKRPEGQKSFNKKRKDNMPKPKRNFDYVSKENGNPDDSPFAILAKLKADMGKS